MTALPALLERFARPRQPETLPVTFDRRRVYVLPTRFGLFFAVLLLAMTLGALNYNNNPAFLLALLLVGAGIASLVAAQLQLSGLSITAVDAEPVHAGQPLHVRVHARAAADRARTGLQVRAAAGPDVAVQATLHLAQGFGETTLGLPTERRGWFDVPRLRIATTRPLGLALAWAYAWPTQPLLVYPHAERDPPPLPVGTGDAAQARLHPTGDDVHHLRAYRAGDPRRAIAWKHSARRDQLLVREYEQPLGADVLLDWAATRGLAHEARITRLAGWVDAAERDGRRYRLRIPGHDLGPAHGAAHRHACLRALALMADG